MDGCAVAAALGLVTGAALLVSERVPRRYGALITVAIAFLVALAVFLLLRAGWGSGILAALLAPLVVLLPGALLTTAVLELSTGHMISGAGRAAAGGMQLVLLGAGIVTAGALVGVPDFDFSQHPELLGPVAPWIAVAVFGVAVSVHRSAPRRALPWILLVLYIAYAAQVLGDLALGGVLSAFVGALCVTPVTALVAGSRRGRPHWSASRPPSHCWCQGRSVWSAWPTCWVATLRRLHRSSRRCPRWSPSPSEFSPVLACRTVCGAPRCEPQPGVARDTCRHICPRGLLGA